MHIMKYLKTFESFKPVNEELFGMSAVEKCGTQFKTDHQDLFTQLKTAEDNFNKTKNDETKKALADIQAMLKSKIVTSDNKYDAKFIELVKKFKLDTTGAGGGDAKVVKDELLTRITNIEPNAASGSAFRDTVSGLTGGKK